MKKQRSFTFVMAIVVAVLLNGCAKHPGFLKNPKAPNRKDTGLVVSSYSSPRNNIAYGGMRNHIITYISLYAPHGSRRDSIHVTDIYLKNDDNTRLLDNSINNLRLIVGNKTYLGTMHDSMIAFENMTDLKVPVRNNVICTLMCDVNAIMNTMDSVTFRLKMATFSGRTFAQTAGTINGIRAISGLRGRLVNVKVESVTMFDLNKFVRGYPLLSKKNIIPTVSEFARFDLTALGNRIWVSGLSLNLINVVMNHNVVIQIYEGGMGGTLVYSGPPHSTVIFNQPGKAYVEIPNGKTTTFSVKVINPVPTTNGTLRNLMGITINNVLYSDKLDNGDVAIQDLSHYRNSGLFPFTWNE